MSTRIKTLGELKDSNWKSKRIKDELRDNLIKNKKNVNVVLKLIIKTIISVSHSDFRK